MAAPVRIESTAFADPRFELLGQLAGYNRFEALGRMAHLWSLCTEWNSSVVSLSIVRACLGSAGAAALVEAELGEAVDSGIRVRGANEARIGWYTAAVSARREAAQRAGRVRAAAGARDERGRLVSSGEPVDPGASPASDQRPTSVRPASDQRHPASRTRTRTQKEPPSEAHKRSCDPPLEAVELADQLRASILAVKPNHRLGEDAGWSSTRTAWAKTLAKTLKRRPNQAIRAVMAYLADDQAGAEFRFVVESAKAFDEKLDRIEIAMARRSNAPARASPDRGLTAAEIWNMANEQEARERGGT